MSFDWSNYLNLARELHKQGSEDLSKEAELRSAISRAYYAVFCNSRNYFRDSKHISLPSGADVHKAVQNLFFSNTDKEVRAIGVKLDRLRRFRNQADYDNTFIDLNKTSKLCIDIANDAITDLKSL